MNLTLRTVKGSRLTWQEGDDNFLGLSTGELLEATALAAKTFTSLALSGSLTFSAAPAVLSATAADGLAVTTTDASGRVLKLVSQYGNARISVSGGGAVAIDKPATIYSSLTLTDAGGGIPTTLVSDAANMLAVRSGTNAQWLNVYNTFTNASNYERGQLAWSGVTWFLGTQKAGTGAARDIAFMVGGTSYWRVNTSGHLLAEVDGGTQIGLIGGSRIKHLYAVGGISVSANSGYTKTDIPNGMFSRAANLLMWGVNGAEAARLGATGVFETGGSNAGIAFGGSSLDVAGTDLFLVRGAADVLEQRRSTNAQTLNVYQSFTDGANYERGQFGTGSGVVSLLAQAAGTGTAPNLTIGTNGNNNIWFRTNGTNRWFMDTSGTFGANLDATYNIGAPAASRPANIYAHGGSSNIPNIISTRGGFQTDNGRCQITNSDGNPLVLLSHTGVTNAATRSIDLSTTWNNGASTFTQIFANVTDTASAAASKLIDLQVATSSKFSVEKGGIVRANDNYITHQNLTYVNAAGTTNYNGAFGSGASGLRIVADHVIAWNNQNAGAVSVFGGTNDLILRRDAAGTLAQRDGTNAQKLRVYNTFTDASNFERGTVEWSSNKLFVGTSKLGTGLGRTLALYSTSDVDFHSGDNGTARWRVDSANGHLLAVTDNTHDIGASGATRPRHLYLAGDITIGGGSILQNSKSAAYTTVLADANKHIYHPSSDNNARTFTIDSNANVPYAIGTCITFVNEINIVTIAITSDTLTLQGAGTTGSRTLAANGIATAMKVASTKWVISGTGLT